MRRPCRHRRTCLPRLAVLVAASVATLALFAPCAGASRLLWVRCPAGSDAALAGFRCARFRVPLDYRHPRGRRITPAVVKHPATRPWLRAGTLFMNPGGPGGTGTVEIPDWYLQLPTVVRASATRGPSKAIRSSAAIPRIRATLSTTTCSNRWSSAAPVRWGSQSSGVMSSARPGRHAPPMATGARGIAGRRIRYWSSETPTIRPPPTAIQLRWRPSSTGRDC